MTKLFGTMDGYKTIIKRRSTSFLSAQYIIASAVTVSTVAINADSNTFVSNVKALEKLKKPLSTKTDNLLS